MRPRYLSAEKPGEAGQRETRPAMRCATRRERRSIGIQHGAAVVVRAGILRVPILREHDELVRIFGAVAQRMEVEGAPPSLPRCPRHRRPMEYV